MGLVVVRLGWFGPGSRRRAPLSRQDLFTRPRESSRKFMRFCREQGLRACRRFHELWKLWKFRQDSQSTHHERHARTRTPNNTPRPEMSSNLVGPSRANYCRSHQSWRVGQSMAGMRDALVVAHGRNKCRWVSAFEVLRHRRGGNRGGSSLRSRERNSQAPG